MGKIKPICFANGDETTGLVAKAVREILFPHIPMEEVDVSVESRLQTKDDCLRLAARAFRRCGSGLKISTASDDERIKELEMGSANIMLRPLSGAFGMLRMTMAEGKYHNPVAVLRYGHGGFYDEQSCEVIEIEGRKTAVITTHMDLDDIQLFAKLACDIAKKYGFPVIISSKWTIAKSEALFMNEFKYWLDYYRREYKTELTDIAIARIAKDNIGGWIRVFDNPNGDTAADVADFVHGNNVMCSTVYCRDGYTYEELPGGTAPDKLGTDLMGENFFNPLITIFGFANAIEAVNPEMADFCSKVRKASLLYLDEVSAAKRSTYEMLHYVDNMLSDRSPEGIKRLA